MIDQLLDGFAEFDDTSNVIEHEADFLSSVIGTSVENKVSTSIDMIEDVVNMDDESMSIDNHHTLPDGTCAFVQTDDFALDKGETTGSVGFVPSHETAAALNETAGGIGMVHPREDGFNVVFRETTGSVGFSHPHEDVGAISFGSKEDMLPYDEMSNHDLGNPMSNPIGIYASRFPDGLINTDDCIPKPELPIDFTEGQLQDACNKICDVLHIRHLPVFLTTSVPNAEHMTLTGPFRFTLVDDTLSLNPDFAKECIENVGTTDIVLSDMGHEIGHAMAAKYCGNLSTYMNEKVADFISGFVNAKIGVDIDAPRQWFMSEYDPDGRGGYPVSEERWDIEAAGYYFGQLASSEELKMALKDPDFLKIIRDYNSDSVNTLAQEEWIRLHADTNILTDSMASMLDNIKKYTTIKRF